MATDDKQSDAAGTGAMPWLGDLKKMAEKFALPGFDIAAFVEWQRMQENLANLQKLLQPK
jgi:hypothetical protein